MFCFLHAHGIQVLWTSLPKCTRRLAFWNARVVLGMISCFRYAVACCAIRLRTSHVLRTSPCQSMRWHQLSIPSVVSRFRVWGWNTPTCCLLFFRITRTSCTIFVGDICSSQTRPIIWMRSRRHVLASSFHSCAQPLLLIIGYTLAPL